MIRGVGVRRRVRAGGYRAPRGRAVREMPAWAGDLVARAPLAAVLLLLVWSPVRSSSGLGAAAVALLWALAYALTLVVLIAGRARVVKLLPTALPILAVVVLALVSPLWSDSRDLALKRAFILLRRRRSPTPSRAVSSWRNFLKAWRWRPVSPRCSVPARGDLRAVARHHAIRVRRSLARHFR